MTWRQLFARLWFFLRAHAHRWEMCPRCGDVTVRRRYAEQCLTRRCCGARDHRGTVAVCVACGWRSPTKWERFAAKHDYEEKESYKFRYRDGPGGLVQASREVRDEIEREYHACDGYGLHTFNDVVKQAYLDSWA